MAAAALIFDVDGTLWDSYPWYAEVLAGLSGRSATEIQGSLSDGDSIVRLAGQCGIADGRFTRACLESAGRLRLYPGVADTLASLELRGTPCGVVTSLPGRIVEPLLEEMGLSRYFPIVIHAGSVRARKPSPVPLQEAVRRMGLNHLADVYYIGDASTDAVAAQRAGMRFAWATYGYGGSCPVVDATDLHDFRQVLGL